MIASKDTSGSLLPPNSTQAKIDVATIALRLRDEQIQAKIIYFGAEQKTNSDLDKITEQVIAELQALQSASAKQAPAEDRTSLEIELIGMLRTLLEKLFSNRREGFLRKKIQDIQRRITTLFFNSELFVKISAGSSEARTFAWPDQALFYLFRKHRETLLTDLKSFQYANPDVLQDATERLNGIEKGLRLDFLSRTTPELEKLLEVYREELVRFLNEFRGDMGEFCWEVIRESRVAHGKLYGYKLGAELFASFREVFDKKFLQRLVLNVQEPLVRRATEMHEIFRHDTVRFVADPHIFTEICTVVCESVYDYLYSEGFLDLPAQWRAHLYK